MMVFSIRLTFSRINQSGLRASSTSMPGKINRLRSSSLGLFPSRIAADILPAPLDDIPWHGGDKVSNQGGLPDNLFWK